MTSISDILSTRTDDFLHTYIADIVETPSAISSPLQGEVFRPQEERRGTATPPNLTELTNIIHAMKDQLDAMLRVLSGDSSDRTQNNILANHGNPGTSVFYSTSQIIEGVFNGEKMVGADGKEYSVPPNYASKSKLVEGDIMKLTITPEGKFIYKQTGPIERKRIVGELVHDIISGNWQVSVENRPYRVLLASVTFHRAAPGAQVVILVPKDGESSWGAVENIVHLSA